MGDIVFTNRLRKIAKSKGISNNLLAILMDVDGTMITSWMNNIVQPNEKQIKRLTELLEVSYQDLIFDDSIGKARSLEDEFDNLIRNKKMSLKVLVTDKKTGKAEKVYNPKIIKTMKTLEAEYKKAKK
ncbi:helix-turn-helix transcriptional regulator [Myroides guanonis]|uniref:HTH cro/C1-type domain-containing protein n=1 Tax=Myroides guanonis TaxID=1150112 RepID=A0A1I3PH80_9FLAO|nr:helix-turn-helix transcriptional regulator [Myroides guanonis]SFJ20700.1 hypothetical protein SAMN04487893_104123 [Myroides guanonis]